MYLETQTLAQATANMQARTLTLFQAGDVDLLAMML